MTLSAFLTHKRYISYKIYITYLLRLADSLSEDGDFEHAADLVAFIREQYGETFCICVAGYPEMHPESPSKELDLHYLKAKVTLELYIQILYIYFATNYIFTCFHRRKVFFFFSFLGGRRRGFHHNSNVFRVSAYNKFCQ